MDSDTPVTEQKTTETPSAQGNNNITLLIKIIGYALIIAFILKAFLIEAFRIPTGSMEKTLLPGDMILVNKAAYDFATPANLPFIEIPLPRAVLFTTSTPKRFDVITFVHPGGSEEIATPNKVYYIKRLIALPGETVSIVKRKVYINNTVLVDSHYTSFSDQIYPESLADESTFPKGMDWNRDYYGPFTLPKKGMTIQFTATDFLKYRIVIGRELGSSLVWEGGKVFCNGKQLHSYTFQHDYYFVLGDSRDNSFDSRYWGPITRENIQGEALCVYLSVDPDGQGFFSSFRWSRSLRFIP